jgi:hypothetical protein
MELKNGLCSTVAIAQHLDHVRQGEEVNILETFLLPIEPQ